MAKAKRIEEIEGRSGASYPAPFEAVCAGRFKRRLGDAFGLDRFGVNMIELAPGAASALRHWHSHEDEFVMVLDGEVTLVTDAGEELLGPGDCAGFKAGEADGHHLVNKGDAPARVLEVGSRDPADSCFYPDVDLEYRGRAGGGRFTRKDGTPY